MYKHSVWTNQSDYRPTSKVYRIIDHKSASYIHVQAYVLFYLIGL